MKIPILIPFTLVLFAADALPQQGGRPRLMLVDERLEELKARYDEDEVLQKCVKDVLSAADGCLGKAPPAYKLIGPRLLHVSRDALRRIYALGLAWRWTKEKKYAEKAEEVLLAVCAFKDWNPSHFLDTAEMSHAVGVGYDWLYSCLGEKGRETIRRALIEKGLKPGLAVYEKGGWWTESAFNWNQVCNGGLLVGALSIADSDPEYLDRILPFARKSLPKALETFKPDGAWGEGPGYWNYATSYTVYGIHALKTALGDDFGLSDNEGLALCGLFPIYGSGPFDLFLNYADSGERSRRKTLPVLFLLAARYDLPVCALAEHAMLERYPASPLHVIWYVPPPSPEDIEDLPLDKLFLGPVEVAVFRSGWDDRNAFFVGVKAGYNQVNHGHLDLGNFEFDAQGVRWARDLGSDNYNLPGYWDRGKGGRRWTYYRMNSKSHNVPLVNGEDQNPLATSRIIRFESKPDKGFAVVDFTSAYERWATRAQRGVALTFERRALIVQDEFDLKKTCDITFGMTTDAKIELLGGGAAMLSLYGKNMRARILCPEGAEFSVESAEQEAPQKTNKGVRRLLVRLEKQEGMVTLALSFTPVEKGVTHDYRFAPLSSW